MNFLCLLRPRSALFRLGCSLRLESIHFELVASSPTEVSTNGLFVCLLRLRLALFRLRRSL